MYVRVPRRVSCLLAIIPLPAVMLVQVATRHSSTPATPHSRATASPHLATPHSRAMASSRCTDKTEAVRDIRWRFDTGPYGVLMQRWCDCVELGACGVV